MIEKINNIKTAKLLFYLSLSVFAYYFSAHLILDDVYKYAAVGAIYELLSIPILLSLALIPITSLFILFKNNAKPRLYATLSILLVIITILILWKL